jgi:hypothetical protein
MCDEAAVYEGQRGVLTIATGTWFGRGRHQEASVLGRASPAIEQLLVSKELNNCLLMSVYDQDTNEKGPKAEVCGLFMKFIIFRPLSFLSEFSALPCTT